jgi:DNA-nicking Smr family endonuclease
VATQRDDDADAEEFERAMSDVKPLEPDPRGRNRPRPPIRPPTRARRPAATPSIDDDADRSNEDFVAPGVNRREIKKLKRGEYTAGDRTNLHHLTAAEACAIVERFIDESCRRGHRCVCIVHGRGLHSEGAGPVLKPRVRAYLEAHRSVLAYADAPLSDGGPGAVYVLLRK